MQVQTIYRSVGNMGIIIDTAVEETEVTEQEPVLPDHLVKRALFRGMLLTEQEVRDWDNG